MRERYLELINPSSRRLEEEETNDKSSEVSRKSAQQEGVVVRNFQGAHDGIISMPQPARPLVED